MEPHSPHSESDKPGVITGLFGIARNLLGLVFNRVELALLELSDLGGHVAKFALLVALSLVALWFSLAFLTVLIVYLVWQFWGWYILLAFFGLFTIMAAGFAWWAWRYVTQGGFFMPLTTAELRRDRDTLL